MSAAHGKFANRSLVTPSKRTVQVTVFLLVFSLPLSIFTSTVRGQTVGNPPDEKPPTRESDGSNGEGDPETAETSPLQPHTASRLRPARLRNVPPPTMATPAQELMREQIEELARAGNAEAIETLIKLFDESADQLVPRGEQQTAATLAVQRYTPIRTWVRQRLALLVQENPELQTIYDQRALPAARAALEQLKANHDVPSAELECQRYCGTSLESDLAKLLTDLYLERGWTLAAMQSCQWLSSDLRVAIMEENSTSYPLRADAATLPWSLILPLAYEKNSWGEDSTNRRLSDASRPSESQLISPAIDREALTDPRLRSLLQKLRDKNRPDALANFIDAAERINTAASISPELIDWEPWSNLFQLIAAEVSPEQGKRLRDLTSSKTSVRERSASWSTFAGNFARNPVASGVFTMERWPAWSHQALPLFLASSDQNPASKPRVGEQTQSTLPYFPVVDGSRVYVNAMTQILAYDLESGQAWPASVPSLPLFDSHMSSAAYLPLGYPILGSPRATLSVSQNCLYARMGSPITGWADARSAPTSSESYLIGLDLTRDGAMLPGFPLRLEAPEFGNPNYDGTEFDGPPVIAGELLLAPTVERDNVGVRRRVVAFDRTSGRLLWKSQILSTGAVEGSERANLIAHQLLTVSGGRIYYNTNLGAVACLNLLSGRIEWLTQYDRHVNEREPDAQRYRYRDLTPCLIHRGLLYCAPQDCPEIFALDPTTGDLIWSTDADQAPDAIHLLGVQGDSLIVSGDRLTWLDRATGRIQAKYPGSHTPGRLNSLPSPRGLGRGVIANGLVYWPISGEVLVFDAQVQNGFQQTTEHWKHLEPKLVRRIRLGARSSDGGNLIVAGDYLIYASPMRLMAYKATSTN